MVALEDSIEIKASPQKVFNWLKDMESNYKSWHPDHVKWVNESGTFNEGSICYCEEYLHGQLHKFKSRYTKIEEPRVIEYKNFLPMSIICPKGSFEIEPKGRNCIFTARLYFRLGWFFNKFAKERVESFKQHLKEEGENLKTILEEK